jgi:hypothetical protein
MKFLTLPDELLMNISDNVAYEDLPNFRLTCKTLANIAAKQFGQKRLAHRRFILTEYSLKGLGDMTAHPVFGPCVKSIMFGTDHLTNDLEVVMDALESNKITDPAEAMDILQMYRERCKERSKFHKSRDLHRMLAVALTNLSSHGTSVSLGIFNSVRREFRGNSLMRGYGSSRCIDGLPFRQFMTLNKCTLRAIQAICRSTNFHPEILELDLCGQDKHDGMAVALSVMLLNKGELETEFDVCIREGLLDIRILSSLNRLEFKQRYVDNRLLTTAEQIRFDLSSLGLPMATELLSRPFTHLHLKSCSMSSGYFVNVLESLTETLQVVELVDVAFWGDQCQIRNLEPVLHCLRHDVHLQTLVLDDVRAMNKDYGDYTGITLAKGRFWHGHQQINAGLDVLIGYDGQGWDEDELYDYHEETIRSHELSLQDMEFSKYEHLMDYTEFLADKANWEWNLEDRKREYNEYKQARDKAKEAMARVDAGDFST